MLVLALKVGQEINIGDDIVIKLKEINRGQARLVFTAPIETQIIRDNAKVKEPKEKKNAPR